jgi:hypothetical protein
MCEVCGKFGDHYTSKCPLKITGVPAVLQQLELRKKAEEDVGDFTAKQAQFGSGVFNALYIGMPADFLDTNELKHIIARRPDVPAFLRCYACLGLVEDPRWCSCCDIVVCRACFGPGPDPTNGGGGSGGGGLATRPNGASHYQGCRWCCPKCHAELDRDILEDVGGFQDPPRAFRVEPITRMAACWARHVAETIDVYSQPPAVYLNTHHHHLQYSLPPQLPPLPLAPPPPPPPSSSGPRGHFMNAPSDVVSSAVVPPAPSASPGAAAQIPARLGRFLGEPPVQGRRAPDDHHHHRGGTRKRTRRDV